MKRKTVSGIMPTLLLIGILILTFNIQPVKAGGTIYIWADGSVDPDTAPISTVDNITYTFTDNIINNSIVVKRDNIVINGAGYTVQGTGSGTGIDLSWRSNVTIKNVEIKSFYYNIYLEYSSNNSIVRNNITNNDNYGVSLWDSSNNTISGNNITNNGIGVSLWDSSNNTISGNNITNKVGGIDLFYSSGNTVFGNNIKANDWTGVSLWDSSNNTISGNNITETNWIGIAFFSSSNYNNISGNNITNNVDGIMLSISSNNSIYHNNFVDNSEQVISGDSINVWDDGYPSGGNYWSDHVTVDDYSGINQDELGSDGIVDEPYVIDDYNRDNYPLMEPWAPLPPIPTTLYELKTEIEELGSEGEIDNKGIVKSLIAKLNVAQKLVDKGKIDEAKTILADDFIPQVQKLSGIRITVEATDILIESAEYIMSHL